jgi:hypothetical protein
MLYTKICLPNIFFLVPLFPDIRILDVVGFDFADLSELIKKLLFNLFLINLLIKNIKILSFKNNH